MKLMILFILKYITVSTQIPSSISSFHKWMLVTLRSYHHVLAYNHDVAQHHIIVDPASPYLPPYRHDTILLVLTKRIYYVGTKFVFI